MARKEFLDYLKGVLITLVCTGHASQYVIHQNVEFWQDPLFKAIYMFHMPLFMAVAGYLSYRGMTTTNRPLDYIRTRAVSYLLPIAVWATLFQLGIFFVLGRTPPSALPLMIGLDALNGLWFLWALLESMSLTAIAQATGKYRPMVLSMLFIATLFMPDSAHLYLFKYTFPFFVAGFLAANLPLHALRPKRLIYLFIVCGIGSFLCFLFWSQETYIYISKMSLDAKNLPNILLRWVAGSVVSIFALILSFYSYRMAMPSLRQWFVRVGRHSLNIYILQGFVFLFGLQLSKRFFHFALDPLLGDTVALAIGVAVASACLWIGQRLAQNRYAACLLFGKFQSNQKPVVASALIS